MSQAELKVFQTAEEMERPPYECTSAELWVWAGTAEDTMIHLFARVTELEDDRKRLKSEDQDNIAAMEAKRDALAARVKELEHNQPQLGTATHDQR